MRIVKGLVEACVSLNKSNCYFMRTGRCSLSLVGDFYLSPGTKIARNDLLYCPHMYRAIKTKKNKPITVVPCQCGHAEVVSGAAVTCIASRTNKPLFLNISDDMKDACPVCRQQLSFIEQKDSPQILTLRAAVKIEDEDK